MTIATTWSTESDPRLAFETAYLQLCTKLSGDASLLLAFHTERYPAAELLAAVRALPPGVRVHATSSCAAVMTEEGFHSVDGRALGLWGLRDPEGAFGVGIASLQPDPSRAAVQALEQALAEAGRPGEAPHMVWISAAPGSEEAVLAGIREVLGNSVPVLGGTAGDNEGTGRWSVLTRQTANDDAIAISVLYSSHRMSSSFQSGYSPTEKRGHITAATGRVLQQIDGRPAAEVYNEWTGGLISSMLGGGNLVTMTSFAPLGRVAGTVERIAYYQLSHLDAVTGDGGLSLFTEVHAGEDIWLMTGSRESLVSRAARVTSAALELDSVERSDVLGALVVYCAGCLRTVMDDMPRVVSGLNASLGGKPFLGGFTYGEQGCVVGRESVHGNLMVSSIVFSR